MTPTVSLSPESNLRLTATDTAPPLVEPDAPTQKSDGVSENGLGFGTKKPPPPGRVEEDKKMNEATNATQPRLVERRRILVECKFEIWVDYADSDNDPYFDIEDNHCPGTGLVGSAVDACMEEHEAQPTCWACALNGSNKILEIETYMGEPFYKCADCLGDGHGPMVHRDIWAQYGAGDGMLCQQCLETRMGRPLREWDRNQPWWPDQTEG